VERIRFASPHPRHVTPRLIETVRDLPRVAKHLHLPVQSGSTRILKAMRRRYSRELYLDLTERLRQDIPGLALSTDVIVGFPGETVEDFEQTISLVQAARYHSMFSFKYSPRPRTLASQRMADDVTEMEKTRRIVELQAVQKSIQGELLAGMVGRIFRVLVDSPSRRRAQEVAGRTSGNTIVNFPGEPSLIGRMVPVVVTEAGPNSLRGHVETGYAN
jgi:tRNA-2-methylthio-N6-dimethylallyladenosine synthase